MCDVNYVCDNFSVLRPLLSRRRPMYATDRQNTDRRQTASSLYALAY